MAEPDLTEIQNRLQRAVVLLELGSVLNSTLVLPKLLDLIVESARQMTDSEASSILLLDGKSGELYFEAASGSGEAIKRVVVPLDSSAAGWVCRTGQPLIIDNTSQDKRFYREADAQSLFTTRSILAVPLKVKDKIIGCLEAVNKKGGAAFSTDDTETLATLAGQAAIAIQNARLFEQSDQIAEMVHELRTPLTGIVAYSELLLRPNLKPEIVTQSAQTIHTESRRLAQFINDFLDLARLESGRTRIARAPVDVPRLVQEVVQLMQPQAVKGKLTLTARVPAELPTIKGDSQRLKQIMINLVSNAIKYNREGGQVTISVSAEGDHLRVEIKDTGKGMPADALPNLFKKFYRVPDSEGWAQGTGLGLSIVKQLVEAHGGQIRADSQVGVGTTMTFTLPLAKEK